MVSILPLVAVTAVLAIAWPHRPAAPPRVLRAEVVQAHSVGSIDPRTRRIALGVAVLVASLLVTPLLGVVGALVVGGRVVVRRRAAARSRHRAVVDELPEVVDLLSLAVSAGLTVPLAVEVVADRGSGDVARQLGIAHESSGRGTSLADSLERCPAVLGDEVRGLVRVLVGSLRDGSALGPALERLGEEVRLDRRRSAEERARRLPVQLLFPLVVCVLPAFGLLTVVPLLAGSLSGIEW
jgi:tight adherence protein C